ncbi:MAG: CBS domain-containing protein [Promethearchaeia archaeon]
MKVQGIMIEDVVTVQGDTSIKEAIDNLYNRHIGSVIVIDEDSRCEGIFTERDAIRVVATDVPLDTPLKKVMTRNLKTVPLDATFSKAKRIMDTHHIRHLPVVDNQGRIMGLLSLREILDELFGIHGHTA